VELEPKTALDDVAFAYSICHSFHSYTTCLLLRDTWHTQRLLYVDELNERVGLKVRWLWMHGCALWCRAAPLVASTVLSSGLAVGYKHQPRIGLTDLLIIDTTLINLHIIT